MKNDNKTLKMFYRVASLDAVKPTVTLNVMFSVYRETLLSLLRKKARALRLIDEDTSLSNSEKADTASAVSQHYKELASQIFSFYRKLLMESPEITKNCTYGPRPTDMYIPTSSPYPVFPAVYFPVSKAMEVDESLGIDTHILEITKELMSIYPYMEELIKKEAPSPSVAIESDILPEEDITITEGSKPLTKEPLSGFLFYRNICLPVYFSEYSNISTEAQLLFKKKDIFKFLGMNLPTELQTEVDKNISSNKAVGLSLRDDWDFELDRIIEIEFLFNTTDSRAMCEYKSVASEAAEAWWYPFSDNMLYTKGSYEE